ncbi:MAG TPA: alpha/beta fold hydrolase [Allosphingosinicella sp.]|nr:alpha/beta fold hydrolase [Allosphingosinicella sp.]
MFRFLLIGAAAIGLAACAHAQPRDGDPVSSKPCVRHPVSYEDYAAAVRKVADSEAALGAQAGVPQPSTSDLSRAMFTRAEYAAMAAHPYACRAIFYGSDGLKVAAYIWEPANIPAGAKLPVVVSLRGGNQDFGKFTPDSHWATPALVAAGFVVVGVQYRGVDGGEGNEQFGGDDVHDVLNAVALARRLPEADPRNVFLVGVSRGGMMAYLALRDGAKVNAAAAVSAMTDMAVEARRRPAMETNVWRKLIPNYDADREAAWARRSGLKVAREVDLPPMLILHGTADWRVDPDESIAIAQALQARGRPYSLHIFDNDVHGILWNWRERDRLLIDWFRQHMAH